jgi:hypothetical protein
MNHKIAVVFDPEFGERLCTLTENIHVWTISSQTNDKAIKAYMSQRRSRGDDPLAHGITEFEGTDLTPELMETIWDHHGEFTHDPPLSEMMIIGLSLRQPMIDLLYEYGFEIVSCEHGDFTVIEARVCSNQQQ